MSARKMCTICLQQIEPNSNSQRYCGDACKKFAQKKLAEQKKPKKKSKSLFEWQKEASEHGMSYGKYVASMQKGDNICMEQ